MFKNKKMLFGALLAGAILPAVNAYADVYMPLHSQAQVLYSSHLTDIDTDNYAEMRNFQFYQASCPSGWTTNSTSCTLPGTSYYISGWAAFTGPTSQPRGVAEFRGGAGLADAYIFTASSCTSTTWTYRKTVTNVSDSSAFYKGTDNCVLVAMKWSSADQHIKLRLVNWLRSYF